MDTFTTLQALHKKYAPSKEMYALVFTHCQIVCDIAHQLLSNKQLHVNIKLVEIGCLIHDMGVYPLFDAKGNLRPNRHYIQHGTIGESILKQEGYPEIIQRFASHHTGVGLTRADITLQRLPLRLADYTAETDEELLVMYADKFHSKSNPPHFNTYNSYKQSLMKFGSDKIVRFEAMTVKFDIPDLAPLTKKYGHGLL